MMLVDEAQIASATFADKVIEGVRSVPSEALILLMLSIIALYLLSDSEDGPC